MTEPDETPKTDASPQSSEAHAGEVTEQTEPAETAASEQPYFADDVWQKLRAQDRSAAKAIAVLLTGLFIVGLILYGIIAAVAKFDPLGG